MATQKQALRLADILAAEHNSFGVIRVAMALAVMASHSFFFVSGDPLSEPMIKWTGHSLGEHAVQVFFFLSGILVTESVLRSRSPLDFVTGRVLRIFPGLLLCVILTAVLLGPVIGKHGVVIYFKDAALPSYVVKTMLLISGAAPLPGVFEQLPAAHLVNMSLWTLKYEVLCYAVLAIVGFTVLRHDRWRRAGTATLAVLVSVIFLRSPVPGDAYSSLENLRYFALYFGVGTLAALNKEKLPIDWKATGLLGVGYLALVGTPLAELSCALFLGSLTLLAATWRYGPLRALANRFDLSFGIYIYGAPIQQALLQADQGLGVGGLTLAALIPTITLAAASWFWIEKPAQAARSIVVGRVTAWIERCSASLPRDSSQRR